VPHINALTKNNSELQLHMTKETSIVRALHRKAADIMTEKLNQTE